MKRRPFLASVLAVPLAGCGADQRPSDAGTPTESDTPTEVTTTPSIPDLYIENWISEEISGEIIVRKETTATTSSTVFRSEFSISSGSDTEANQVYWDDIELMDDQCTVSIKLERGLSGRYDWDGGAGFNEGLVAVLKEDVIEFHEEIA